MSTVASKRKTTIFAIGALILAAGFSTSATAQVSTEAGSKSTASSEQGSSAPKLSAHQRAHQAFMQAMASFVLDHDRAKAQHGFMQVTEMDPTYAAAWFNLGVLAEADKRWADAQGSFSQYLKLAPNGVDAVRAKDQLRLVSAYAHGGRDVSAEKQADYDGMIQRARVFLSAGLFREAIAEAGRAQTLDASRWQAYAVISICMARQNKSKEALKFEQTALNHVSAEKRAEVEQALNRARNGSAKN